MSDPFLAEIRVFPFNFAPLGWALCNGQLLPISQNTALFSLLGTTYGGDGRSTFALPNLQGSAPLGYGQGPGLSPYDLGETGGSETVTLNGTQLPQHTHSVVANNTAGGSNSPANNFFGQSQARAKSAGYVSSGTLSVSMSPQAVASAGGGQPHNNMPPYLCLNFCIAMQGIFPSRS